MLLGLLTGTSLCPPFLLAFGSAAQLPHVWQSLLFFAAFFLGTSVYILPLPRAIPLTLPILLLMAMMVTGGRPVPQEPIRLIPLIVAYLFTVGAFFLIVYTGRTHRYRSMLFIAYAVAFVMTFIPNLLEMRLASTATLTPMYCIWLCPFKTVTEYAEITSATTLFQAGIFVSLFVGLVVVRVNLRNSPR